MGRPESYGGVDVGVYFGDTKKETDPYFKGLGPMREGVHGMCRLYGWMQRNRKEFFGLQLFVFC